MLGCAVIVAAVIWLIIFLGHFLLTDAGFWASVGVGGLVASILFVSVLVVGLLDRLRHSYRRDAVRRRLLRRSAATDEIAMESVAAEHRPGLLETRRAVAEFFDVPEDRLRASDHLDRDYNYVAFEPWLHWSVVMRASEARGLRASNWQFNSAGLETLADFAIAVERSLSEIRAESPPSAPDDR